MEATERLQEVSDRIAHAIGQSRRPPGSVRLVIVTKGVEAARLPGVVSGTTLFGESRVREALEKREALAQMDAFEGEVKWHLIGHLQHNKVKAAVGHFDLIQSVHSVPLAREIDRLASGSGVSQGVLLQVNLSAEETKQGFLRDEVEKGLEQIRGLPHLSVQGLMTIPPPPRIPEDSRPYFRALWELSERFGLKECSMGMSSDFEVAIEEGATLVRVGTAIFGERR